MSFSWIPFYKELASKLLDYKDFEKRISLVKIIRSLEPEYNNFLTKEKDSSKIIDIHPFAVYSIFNRFSKIEKKKEILQSLKENLNIKSSIPDDFDGIPSVNPQQSFWAMPWDGNYPKNEIEQNWDLFEIAAAIKLDEEKFVNALDLVLQQNGAKWNVTQALFRAFPDKFLSLDENSRNYLSKNVISVMKEKDFNGQSYLKLLKLVKGKLKSGELKDGNLVNLSYNSWLKGNDSEKTMEIIKTMNKQENEKTISLMNLLEVNKNLILHGAPGTGKTYTAKDIAAQMICGKTFSQIESGSEEEKLFNEQTEFVQFHPSYDYSDFVEGLRPIEGENTGDVGFERKDGVFKEFCGKALKSGSVIQTNNFDESWNNLIEYIRNEMSEGRLVKIGNWEYSVSKADSLKYQSVGTKSNYSFTITKENVYLAYQHKKGRPSGYFQKEMEDTVAFMQENFRLAPFSENSISQQKNTKLPYIFIIDEINRGEMSKIFGELFFSIDPDYRGTKGKVRTQYANMLAEQNDFDDALGITSSYGHFFVPENVYIIGTMNDIDRSVDSMDFAMRRRFTFVELKANECHGMLNNLELSEGITKSNIVSKMVALNEEIEKISGLSSAYHIGGSYFAKLSKYSEKTKSEAFECLWNNHLKPLITDYLRGLPNLETKLATFKNKYDAAGIVSEESDN